MHKIVLKFFDFLQNFIQFIKIVLNLSLIILLFYWVQNLLGENWGWLNLFSPIMENLIYAGSLFSQQSISVFNATFEYKYFFAFLLICFLYLLDHGFLILLEKIKEFYLEGRVLYKKAEEKIFNNKLEKEIFKEQKKIKKYRVLIHTSIKQNFSKQELVDLEEQNKIMNKFLIEKTGIKPTVFQGGFLYTFNNFENIDSTIEYLFKLINSEDPLNFIICIQIEGKTPEEENIQLSHLFGLKLVNKISILADTVHRYSFNKKQEYTTSQIGLFQSGNFSMEVHCFEDKDIRLI